MVNNSFTYLSVAQVTTEDYKLNSNKRFPRLILYTANILDLFPF
jgi:hypothetical protein